MNLKMFLLVILRVGSLRAMETSPEVEQEVMKIKQGLPNKFGSLYTLLQQHFNAQGNSYKLSFTKIVARDLTFSISGNGTLKIEHSSDDVFCNIWNGQGTARFLFVTNAFMGILKTRQDSSTREKISVLVVPKAPVAEVHKMSEDTLLTLIAWGAYTAKLLCSPEAYKMNFNCGGRQGVFHVHLHVDIAYSPPLQNRLWEEFPLQNINQFLSGARVRTIDPVQRLVYATADSQVRQPREVELTASGQGTGKGNRIAFKAALMGMGLCAVGGLYALRMQRPYAAYYAGTAFTGLLASSIVAFRTR